VGLDAVSGQPRAVALLQQALAADRVAHAYAFVGAPGSGRTTAALAFATALLCERGTGCGACRGCKLADARQHPDLHVIVPTPPDDKPKGPKAIRIGAVRDLERQAALRPVMGGRKVFVVDDADRMTDVTPQAFLKTLEEPPPRTIIILVLPRARALPATVLSRCQIVPFQPRRDAAGTAALVGEAFDALREIRAKGLDALLRHSQAAERDRDRAEQLIDAYWLLLRDLLLVQSGAPPALLGCPERGGEMAEEAGQWSLDALVRGVAACREARQALWLNVTPRLTLEMVVDRLARRAA
jgi:DNA polymerase-3 subunit delta'